MKFEPRPYQRDAIRWILQRFLVDQQPGCGLFFDPGLGKTSTTLTVVRSLKQIGVVDRVLVLAPKRVVHSVWSQECERWSIFRDLRCHILPSSKEKLQGQLDQDHDIYLATVDTAVNLAEALKKRPGHFQLLICDESTAFKTWGSKRTRAVRKIVPMIPYRLILTGTPSPRSLENVFAQHWILDEGEALGSSITKFRTRWFYQGGFKGYEWLPKESSAEQIQQALAPSCLRLAAEDYLDLPELLFNDIWVHMDARQQAKYRKLEREMFFELDESKTLAPMNSGSKYLMCRQVASGNLYDEDKTPILIHRHKTEALASLKAELDGKPLMIAFMFRHELLRLKSTFPGLSFIDGSVSGKDADRIVDQWNSDQIEVLAVQPQSLSHGVNMQYGSGRDIAWMTLPDDLELYQQLNHRVHRQGVDSRVRIHRVLAKSTVDEIVAERLESKDRSQAELLETIKRYREKINAKA